MAMDTRAEIAEALAEADIRMDVGRFVVLLREALRAVGRRHRAADPASQLTMRDIEQLRAGGLRPSVDLGAYYRVRAQTAAQTAALLASSLSVGQAAERLGVDPSRVRQMLAARALVGVKDGGEWRVLELQFQDRRLVPNIGEIARAIPEGLPLVGVANWLTSPEPDLEVLGKPVSPLEWLSGGGDPGRIVALASEL